MRWVLMLPFAVAVWVVVILFYLVMFLLVAGLFVLLLPFSWWYLGRKPKPRRYC